MRGRKEDKKRDLKARTRDFALRIIRLYSALPKTVESQIVERQLLKSGTSPGAHYREGQRAKSNADFISKMEGALQELEETQYWLEIISSSGMMPNEKLRPLTLECDELIAIFVTNTKARLKSRMKDEGAERRTMIFILHPSSFIL